MRAPNHYADYGLERHAERRADEGWLDARFDNAACVLAVWRSRPFVRSVETPRAVCFEPGEIRPFLNERRDAVFLGLKGGRAHFAFDLSHVEDPEARPPFARRGTFVDLRSVGALLPPDQGGLLAYAKGILHWHERHRFCGNCGQPTESREAGHLRICTDRACGVSHFPRTDPAVIMLIAEGDRAVLGRKAEWPDGMYSALAGFVEPGESLEEAVAREVKEEVAIDVANIRYHSSQPWPFPASLMLGFSADALSGEIAFDPEELEDARWFTREELRQGAAGLVRRARSDSIARRLINDWVYER
ncbi:MAG: NAD(+) diphosphatase [Defluviicoccus sp.]|nr:NAD(+) diphosphatase [Defluviicoccus sp.]